MLFTSYGFLLFLAVVLVVCLVCPGKHRWKALLAASLVFYGMSGLRYLAYISATIVTTYFCARMIGRLHRRQEEYLTAEGSAIDKEEKKLYKAGNRSARVKWVAVCLLFNFGVLAVIKYTDFAIGNINMLLRLTGGKGEIAFFRFALPMGISFYTFQTMGYIIDVFRGKHPAERNLLKLALFASFFPQVVQGPISRFGDLSETLFSECAISAREVSGGLQRVLLGFFKKLVIADRLIIAVRAITDSPGEYQGAFVLAASLLYAVTLYADFTGGIDITIGIAEALGIRVKENFNRPFYAVSTADYWRRWHITMGTWFRDYMFYPISVSKPMLKLSRRTRAALGEGFGKRVPVYMSTIVVWFATGVWHGANWNFVVWGLLNGFVLIVSEECAPLYRKFHDTFGIGKKPVYRAFQVVRTFCLMSLIRTLDIYDGVAATFRMVGKAFLRPDIRGFVSGGLTRLGLSAADYAVAFSGVALLIVIGQLQKSEDIRELLARRPAPVRYCVYMVLIFSIVVFGVYGVGYDAKQFIYNRF